MKCIIPLYQMLILLLRKLHMYTYDLATYLQTHMHTDIAQSVQSVQLLSHV